MSNISYAEKLKHPKWQKKRLEIMQRDNFTCQICKDEETELHIHHFKYSQQAPWEEPNVKLITICKLCHESEHGQRCNFLIK